ncbi:Uma2 family endonuclease [Marinactinospora rubrisoli]|uniref:Uma2 family endonuclease n=1 Tax=Marinactinospora rubrisoli TaxID=2715399 RepID=A0ABW2KJU8_9ACTN
MMTIMATTSEDLLHENELRPLTVDDLALLPNDGKRYELVDGKLIVSAAPFNIHQLVSDNVVALLRHAGRQHSQYRAFSAVGLSPNQHNQYIPDVTLMKRSDYTHKYSSGPPALVVEVTSDSTSLYDRNLKKDRYLKFGVPAYWIIDPDPDLPVLTVYELIADDYKQTAHVVGDEVFETAQPFPIRVVPAELTAW